MASFENPDDDDYVLVGLFGLTIDDDDDHCETRRPHPLPLTGVKVEVIIHCALAVCVDRLYYVRMTKSNIVLYCFFFMQAKVLDFLSEVKLSQCFHNNSNNAMEVVYHFPIDSGAAVCGFQAEYEDGSIVQGLVKERGEAM